LTETLNLPPAVIEMLARYQGLLEAKGWGWGDDRVDMFRWARFARLGDVFAAFADLGDWPAAVRSVVGDDLPCGIIVVRVNDQGVTTRTGSARLVVAGSHTPIGVLIDSALGRAVEVEVAGERATVAAHDATVTTVDVDGRQPDIAVVGLRRGRSTPCAAARC
jgi:hypothetical protein